MAARSLPPPRPDRAGGQGSAAAVWAPPVGPAGSAPGGGAALGEPADAAGGPPPKRLRRKAGGRHRQVKLRLSDDELEAFQTSAAEVNLSVQRYIVETVLAAGGQPVRRPLFGRQQRALLATFMATRRTLAGAANNLNQLTRWSHAHEEAAAGIDEAITAVDAASRRLRLDVETLAASLDPEDDETATGEWEAT